MYLSCSQLQVCQAVYGFQDCQEALAVDIKEDIPGSTQFKSERQVLVG
jgi:hypothetical protein